MDNIIPFIIKHWFLVALFVLLVFALIAEELHSGGAASGLTPPELTQAVNHDEAVVLDIRDREAFQRGHITGAMNIPSADLDQSLNKLNKVKQKKIVVVCQAGRSCLAVSDRLRKSGFTDVTILKGGINAWQAADLPLVTKSKANDKN